MTQFNPDPQKWKQRAMAFAVRAHNHLWGKNNEDPLVFLFRQGITHEFSRKMYLGWNKFGQERPYAGWGISKEGKFIIPKGIVLPHIVEKDLKSLFIISMTDEEEPFIVPGSPGFPMILGNPGGDKVETRDLVKGLLLHQDNPGLAVRIIGPAS